MSREAKTSGLPSIILASSSPRRRELLRQIGVTFRPVPPDIDESILEGESPVDFVMRMAVEKATQVSSDHPDEIVLGSDTIVLLNDEVLGKPVDSADAVSTLMRLSGQTHQVLTSFALVRERDERLITGLGRASVKFRELEPDEVAEYVAGGSPMDKAGSYGIQEDLGAIFIEEIEGDYYTIVGLPVTQVYVSLRRLAAENSG